MKINAGRSGIVMQQQLMAQRASKPNTSNNKTKNAGGGSDSDGDSDGGGETSGAQESDQAGGINYQQLNEAVKAGVIKPPSAPRNREENNGNGDANNRGVSTRQSEQAAKTSGASNVKQSADANASQPNRAENGVYTSNAQTDKQQSTYAKGDIVNLSA